MVLVNYLEYKYKSAYEFIQEKSSAKELYKCYKSLFDETDLNETDNIEALVDYVLSCYGSDDEIICEILGNRESKYIVNYNDELDLFIIYRIEDN